MAVSIEALLPIALAIAAVPAAPLVLRSSTGRLSIVVLGAVVAFGGSEVGFVKYLYVSIVVICAGLSCLELSKRDRTLAKQLIPLTAAMGSVFIVLIYRSLTLGQDPIAVARGFLPYAITILIPLLFADAITIPWRRLQGILVAGGLLSSVAFSINWTSRRGFVDADLTGLFLNSRSLGTALFCYSLAHLALRRSGFALWSLLAASSLLLPLITGTRSSVVMLCAPVLVIYATRNQGTQPRLAKPIAGFLALGAMSLVLGQISDFGVAFFDYSPAVERLSTIADVVRDPLADASASTRLAQWYIAWADFRGSPLLGQGLGHLFVFSHPALPVVQVVPSLDTPLAAISKIGVLGTLTLLTGLIRTSRAVAWRRDIGYAALFSFVGVISIESLLANTPEDKGVALALVLLLALRAVGPRRPVAHAHSQQVGQGSKKAAGRQLEEPAQAIRP